MHREDGKALVQADLEMATLTGFENATLFFQTSLEFRARHSILEHASDMFCLQQKCCVPGDFGGRIQTGHDSSGRYAISIGEEKIG